jgi:hypothetical protein
MIIPTLTLVPRSLTLDHPVEQWSVVAECLGCRILNSGSWVRIPTKARHGICEQDTLKYTAQGSHNEQNCLQHGTPNLSKKRNRWNEIALH